MRFTLVAALILVSGCGSGPKPGREGIIVSSNPAHNDAMLYNKSFTYGFVLVPIGSKAIYVGESPPVKDVTDTLIKVSISSGPMEGSVGAIKSDDWRPLDR